ncbi:hypothetical protein, partial [Escherichia coli]|uniref:hypothetical protein n=1 Tax=Escherichia coli TaxID=562 RepID=UPI001BC8A3F2
AGCSPVTCAQKKRVFLCTHGSLTDPAATRAGSTKSRSKKLCKLVHYRANKKKRLIGALKISIVAVY